MSSSCCLAPEDSKIRDSRPAPVAARGIQCNSDSVTSNTTGQATPPHTRDVLFDSDLPACCRPTPLRLPRPQSVIHQVTGGMDPNSDWSLGLNHWTLTVGVEWDEVVQDLTEALAIHLGRDHLTWDGLQAALADHGIRLNTEGVAWVGSQGFVTASLYSDLNRAAGRAYLNDGDALYYSADADSSDLNELVAPIVDLDGTTTMWSKAVLDQFEDAEGADLAILLRSVRITPILRGHLLGAWAAAQAIALFDHGRSLVATLAAPLARQDGVPGFVDNHQKFTDAEQVQWNAEQARLARHWAKHLGLTPLATDPNILVWHSAILNEALDSTLALWS